MGDLQDKKHFFSVCIPTLIAERKTQTSPPNVMSHEMYEMYLPHNNWPIA